ncbi:MAG: molybdate ABC transporter substrate-binding protein [Betaproteobacteria bacterium]|nr:molybdate ABC transporter substrate-binding protein [Betaproteobacteria bacterium]
MGLGPAPGAEPPVIAAAADLGYALQEAAGSFTRETGHLVKLIFGSSGNFARQIQRGAPFELFLSADEGYVRLLEKGGHTEGGGVPYAVGRVVLFVPARSPVKADVELRDLKASIADGRLRRLAIANPEHAPYGRAAREVLMRAGIWEQVKGRLALGENASQAAQFATTGAAQAGIVPYSLALAPAMADRGSYVLLNQEWHGPLRQRMVLVKGAGDTARLFYDYLQQPEARKIFERYGFALPSVATTGK